jgi:intracellular multiplication protein IcmL
MNESSKSKSNTPPEPQLTKTSEEISDIQRLLDDAREAVLSCRRLSKSSLISTATNLFLAVLVAIMFMVIISQKREYFATNPQGGITPLIALDRPVITDEGVKLVTRDSLYLIMNLNFDTYKQDIERGRSGFIDEGLANILQAMKEAGIFDIMKRNRVNVRTEFGPAVITAKGISKDKAAYWRIEFPITIRFVGQSSVTKPMNFTLQTTVKAVEPKVNPVGVAISQGITRPLKDAPAN